MPTEDKPTRLFKVSRELNVSQDRIVDYLDEEGYELEGSGLNAKVSPEVYSVLVSAFSDEKEKAERHQKKVEEMRAEREEREQEIRRARGEDVDGQDEDAVAEEEAEEAEEGEADEEVQEAETVAEEEEEEEMEEDAVAEGEDEADEEAEDEEEEDDSALGQDALEELEEQAGDVGKDVDAEEETGTVSEPVAETDEVEATGEAEDEAGEEAADEVVRADRYRLDGPKVVDEEAEEEEGAPAEATAEADESAEEEPVEAESDEAAAPVAEGDEEAEAVAEGEEVEGEEEAELEKPAPKEVLSAKRYKLSGPKVVGNVDLKKAKRKKPRKRKRRSKVGSTEEGDVEIDQEEVKKAKKQRTKKKRKKRKKKQRSKSKQKQKDVDDSAVEENIQKTKERIRSGGSRDERRKRRQERRERHAERRRQREEEQEEEEQLLELTEFVSAKELASMLDEEVTDIIDTCMEMGVMVSINQRLDADTITLIADEYGYEVEFIDETEFEEIEIEEDEEGDLEPRAPVVTVMGHVDHGKTSLLDYIRRANVVGGESGGITQHIGAYVVGLDDGSEITFLDTPGHEAFTAMRARGAQVTDIVVLVVAADDAVMPQTIEAINHAQAAGVPIVVAINKMDKDTADPQKVMSQLSEQGVMVEEYGGSTQAAKVSAETGQGVDDLLEKIALQAELLELEANPNRNAVGTVVESRLEKGRGNVATVLVQNGTLEVGDPFVAGATNGRVRAMFDERDQKVQEAPPSTPVLVLGFDDSPDVGDQFVALEDEGEAREIAQRRQQIRREQRLRQKKHVTLDEIGRRLALGDFQELNLIVKADVSGSVQALSDALLELSTEEVQVNIIHSGVGAITESDVLLASASDAVIIGFQVRPMPGIRDLADEEEIDIRTYSVIYDAVEDVRDALEGLLSPERSEEVNGVAEVRELFSVPKVGTVAGAYVMDGKIHRDDLVRVLRDGVVVYDGEIGSLKRFDDDVKEVKTGYECGIGIEKFNDLKEGDHIEAYEIVETKRTLNV